MRRGFGTAVASLVLTFAVPGVVAAADPWNGSGAVAYGDFDNDGNVETVVSSPESDGTAGAVYVVDRSSGTTTRWTRDTSGLVGSGAAAGDYFGAAVAVGDFDGDYYDDLAIGAPGADDTGETDAGVIHVIYGSASGLTTTGDQLYSQDSTGIADVAEAGDQFGDSLTTGDFNCDGYDDVAIGVPREEVSSVDESGAVHVIYGTSGGLRATADYYVQNGGANEEGDHFGATLVRGNFNADESSGIACEDLVIGVPDEDFGANADVGLVYEVQGSSSGLGTPITWHQGSGYLEGSPEANDRFGLHLASGDRDADGYDDLFVSVPGDSCITGHAEGLATVYGASGGLTTSGNTLECFSYLCNIDTDHDPPMYGCQSSSPPVYGSDDGEIIEMFVGDDVVHAGAGDDTIKGNLGDDVLLGGPDSDTFDAGPGLDVQIGGDGDDYFYIDLDCEVEAGEVIDGGPGNDKIYSHLSESELLSMGVTIESATVSTIPEGDGSCEGGPFEEGELVQPRVVLTWDDLPDTDSVYSFSSGTLDLTIENQSDDAVTVDLVFHLTVRGWTREYTDSESISANSSTSYGLDLEEFIPQGIDPNTLPSSMLELPTSAVLWARADVNVSNPHDDLSAYAPTLYGHLEDGDTAVLYRETALRETYYSGDLLAWRAQLKGSAGAGHVVHARAVASAP